MGARGGHPPRAVRGAATSDPEVRGSRGAGAGGPGDRRRRARRSAAARALGNRVAARALLNRLAGCALLNRLAVPGALLLWGGASAASAATPVRTGAEDPAPLALGPGLQWSAPADPAQPWIPRAVRFAGGGEWVWAARAFQTPGALLLGAQEEVDGAVLAGETGWEDALGPPAVDTHGEALHLAARFAAEGGGRLRIARRRPAVGTPAADWTVELPTVGDGAPLLCAGPLGPLVAERVAGSTDVRLTALDAHDGGLRWSLELPGGTLRALGLADDGATALVLAGARLSVVDALTGTPVVTRTHDPAPRAAALSGDGASLALGFAGRVELWDTAPTAVAPRRTLTSLAQRVAVALDLAADGERLAVGWWDAADGAGLALDLWELPPLGPALLDQRHELPGGVGVDQDFVTQVALEGERAAFGLWGDGAAEPAAAGSRPELVLLERGRGAPLASLDLPGSVFGVDLDPRGERVAVARRDGHATVFGTTGAVELVDTGERDLALDRSPAAGAAFAVEFAAQGPAAWVLLGRPGPPLPLPPALGSLALDPAGPVLALVATEVSGRFRIELGVPLAARGLVFALQGVVLGWDGGLALGRTWTHSRVL